MAAVDTEGVVSCEDRDADYKGNVSDQRDSRHTPPRKATVRRPACPNLNSVLFINETKDHDRE